MKKYTQFKTILIAAMILVMVVSGCGGPEAKKQKFFAKGQELYEAGDYMRARLEFKNALQVDPRFAQGYYMLGKTELQLKNFPKAFGAFKKAVELDDALTDAHLQMGLLLRAAGQLDQALEKAELVLVREPGNPEARVLKGSVLMARGDDAAGSYLAGVLRDGQNDTRIYLMLASAQARQDQRGKARQTLLQGIAAHPEDIPLHLGLAQLYVVQGQADMAEGILKKIVGMAPEDRGHQLNLAKFYWSEGRKQAAEQIVDQFVAADPDDEKTRLTAARFFLDARDLKRAQAALEAGIEALPESLRLRLMLAEVFQQRRQPQMAIQVLTACLAMDASPESLDVLAAQNALARVYLSMRQVDQAQTYVDQVLTQKPNNIDAHLTQGHINLFRGEGEAAVNAFRTVKDERSRYIPAYLGLANALLMQKQANLAMDTLKSALKIDPKSRDTRRTLARLHLRDGDPSAAEKELRAMVEAHPGDIRCLLELGDFLAFEKRPAAAEAVYVRALEQFPENPAGYIRLSHFKAHQGDVPEAMGSLEKGLDRNPGSSRLLTVLVQTGIAHQKYARAVDACETFLKISPDSVQAYNLLGFVHTAKKDFATAEKMLKKAIALQPINPAVHDNLAKLYLLQGRKQAAVANLEAAIASMPDSGAAYLTLALIHQRDQDYAKALAVYEKALERNPDFWFAMNNAAFLTGETTRDAAELEKALDLANKALARRPEDPSALDTVGWLHYRLGNYQRALGPIEQALEKAPDNRTILSHMGQVYAALGRPDEAREHLQKALAGEGDFIGRQEAVDVLDKL